MKCSHCHLEYEKSALFCVNIDGNDEYFCCKGCEGIFRILQENNLTSFYDKLADTKLSPPIDYNDDLARFDSDVFFKKYIKELDKDTLEVSLIITKIHCIACVWLNQKVLNNTDGIIDISINYTNNKAKIIYDKNKITLSKIITIIRSIGYDATIYDPKMLETLNLKERKDYYTRMIVGIFCVMNIMWIAIAQYLGYFLGIDSDIRDILNIAGFLLSTPALFYSGWIFFRGGYYGLKNGFINMDLLISAGSTLTYLYSIYAAITRSGETYFESVAMIITFILIGKFLEVRSRKSAGDKIDSLFDEIPSFINIKKDGNIISISPEEVQIGDIICVAPGQKIIIDGILLSKKALLDSSMLTGESMFVKKEEHDEILSGSINLDYHIEYKAQKSMQDSTMNSIINLIKDSIDKKPDIQNKANSISYVFSTFVLSIAFITFILWWYFVGIDKAIIVSVSVIIIACPCALALATPIATIVGITETYKYKLLFKEARILESFAKVNTIIFDKTGTLTFGTPKVVNLEIFDEFNHGLLAYFVRLNNHPISKGVFEYLNDDSIFVLDDFRLIEQKGIQAKHDGNILLGGSAAFMQEHGIKCEESADFYMSFYYAINDKLVARFSLEDKLKDNAKDVIDYFKANGFKVVLLSGDRKSVVCKIAKNLGISQYYYEQSPKDKSDFIDLLHKDGYKNAFVGDGINDAIALNKSDIAISMWNGSDIAIQSSDIVLLDDKLNSLILAHKLALKTYSTIKQNIAISIIYNLLTIPLACFGFIIPLFAALSMSFSSILVTLNSLKISKTKL
ncbi:heavy metal translocating P-type ATPase [Helicobacter sp. MIT 99-5507]|uniref:heavy metal translocating P-type ATPase n=1 Tax=Helicobacter sp. MIT 99-5507 TaxID=152489 RepID=UPI000E1E748C|nr:heavy metal translocating P-type ATPase [Helicobacter sp. MIT 99-5507]RDU56673.1 heavy metal translocating P-type ATPase [Helicobacter sp. MIT 99-5507]